MMSDGRNDGISGVPGASSSSSHCMRSSSSSSDAFVVTDRGEGLMSIFIAGRGSSGAQGRGGQTGVGSHGRGGRPGRLAGREKVELQAANTAVRLPAAKTQWGCWTSY